MDEDNPMSEAESPAPLHRHEEFYYDDGNICLQAENTVFRLLKSQLARQSSVFADMFTIGGEQEGLSDEELYDGVPFIRVTESAKDWTTVCQVLWNSPEEKQPKDFDDIASLLRVSTKYNMEKLRKCSITWLEGITSHRTIDDPLPALLNYDSNPDLAPKVVALALKCDVSSVLPLAMYQIAVTAPSTLSRPTGLAYDVVLSIMIGRDRLRIKWWDLVRGNECLGLDPDVHRCGIVIEMGRSAKYCGATKPDSTETYPRIKMLEDGSRDPILYLSRQASNQGLCAKCRKGHRKAMMEVCKSLVTIFDL